MSGNNVQTNKLERYRARQLNLLQTLSLQMSAIAERERLAGSIGQTHEGKRDTYQAYGYPEKVEFQELWNMYDRNEIAGSLVEFIPEETWRKPPVLIDGDARTDADDEKASEFTKAFVELEKRLKIFNTLMSADIYHGFSRYSVILLGVPGRYEQPIAKVDKKNLVYLAVHHEGSAKISETETQQSSPRYGLPTKYTINFDQGGQNVEVDVHWSRCIHLKEGDPGSRVYGRPRLKRLYNRLIDWEKVLGGGSEAFWQMVMRKIAFLIDNEADVPEEGTPEMDQIDDQIEAFIHNLAGFLKLTGTDVHEFAAQVVSSKEQADVLAGAIAAGSRVPKRKLTGSEMGHLASDQDDKNFKDWISNRQDKKVEDSIFRPFVDYMIDIGVLPEPTVGKENYKIEFPALFELTEEEQVSLATKVVNLINALTGQLAEMYIDPEAFLNIFYGRVAPSMNFNPDIPQGEDDLTDEEEQGKEKPVKEKPNAKQKPA